MHSSRMRTVRCSGNLSCHVCMPPPAMHVTSTLPHKPPAMHTPLPHIPPATHVTCLPCMAPRNTHPLSCMPPCHARPTCGQTETCENITFPQLLFRTVKTRTVNEPPSNIGNIVSFYLVSWIFKLFNLVNSNDTR